MCDLQVIWQVWDMEGEGVSLHSYIQSKDILLLTDSTLIGFRYPILSGINLAQKDT